MANCPTASEPYVGILVTIILFSRAVWTSTILYPVAKTPIYLIQGQASKTFLSIGVLLVITISAFPIREIISLGSVLS